MEVEIWSFAVVGAAALATSGLTLFSGFGLGTLLLPVLALFFPIEVAVAATAIVHLLNNLFKLSLLSRHIVLQIVLRFGLPALLAAYLGARLLTRLAGRSPITTWYFAGGSFEVLPIKLAMGLLILFFAAMELVPRLAAIRAPTKWLPLGGILSGFFGGLSGHQGALRAAFLVPLGLPPLKFAGTQAALGTLVDLSRMTVYGTTFLGGLSLGDGSIQLVVVATVCAFIGVVIGKRLLHKATVEWIRWIAGVLLLLVGTGLASGLL